MEEELGKVGVNFSEDKRSLESWKVEYPFQLRLCILLSKTPY